jgi:MHS family proline/betaine transporter-like MFS transporter
MQQRAILAGIAGNVMEWYDFTVYGYFAAVIGRRFFPAEDPISSLLAAFGVFAVGLFMRPFGSLVFGHLGDGGNVLRALRQIAGGLFEFTHQLLFLHTSNNYKHI